MKCYFNMKLYYPLLITFLKKLRKSENKYDVTFRYKKNEISANQKLETTNILLDNSIQLIHIF